MSRFMEFQEVIIRYRAKLIMVVEVKLDETSHALQKISLKLQIAVSLNKCARLLIAMGIIMPVELRNLHSW
jgi:hypothetical protein